MPYFVYGRDAASGEVAKRLFSAADNEADARREAAERGMQPTAVVACRADDASGAVARTPLARVPVVRASTSRALVARSPAPLASAAIDTAHADPVDSDSAQFRQTLQEMTPNTYVSYTLIGINAGIFLLMTVCGVSLTNPTIHDLLGWGADFGPLTLGGQWWRLFSSVFVHIGFMHLAYNMLAFAYVGPIVERLLGNVSFLALYLVSGLGGALAALYTNAMILHAGASGAVFGVYGALLAIVLMQGRSIPPRASAAFGRLAMIFVAYNLANSLRPGISMAAHIGGLVTGFVCGLMLAQPVERTAVVERPLRSAMAVGFGLLLLAVGIAGTQARYPQLAHLQDVFSRFDTLDLKDSDAVHEAAKKTEKHAMSDAEFADFLDRDMLPEWKQTRALVDAYQPVPQALQTELSTISSYMKQRQDGWELLGDGLRRKDDHKLDEAKKILSDANSAERAIFRTGRAHILPSN